MPKYEVVRYSQFWYGIIDRKYDLYVKGNVGPHKLMLFKNRKEAENECEKLNRRA